MFPFTFEFNQAATLPQDKQAAPGKPVVAGLTDDVGRRARGGRIAVTVFDD